MATKEKKLHLMINEGEQALLLKAVNEHIKLVGQLAAKVESQGYVEAARQIGIAVSVLKDIENKLL